MNMKIFAAAALVFAVCVAGGASAGAQTVPCVGCAISATQSAIQSQINQQIITQSVQNAVNAQIQTQSTAQQIQAQQMRVQLQNQLLQNANSLQTILLEQQLQLLQLNSFIPANFAVPNAKTKKKPTKH
jgi:phosphotransferase system  glucose/maltose/N-acetylglucosamine-specific IIC component